jgi:hypothetical protein
MPADDHPGEPPHPVALPPRPSSSAGALFRNFDLAEIARYIDWGPFFQTWDLHGAYPAILNDEVVGESARRVFSDGKSMLKRVIDGRWLTANAAVGVPAGQHVNDDDIEVYTDESRREVAFTWRNLRQQTAKREGVDNKCLADFIAPKTIDGGRRASPTTSGCSRSPPASGSSARKRSSPICSTTTRRSCSRRSPTGSPRPSPSACTSACARTCGATRRTSRWTRRR